MAKKNATPEQSLKTIMMNCRNALRGTIGGNHSNCGVVGVSGERVVGSEYSQPENRTLDILTRRLI